VRLRLEGGVQCSPDPPSRRRFSRLLRMRPSETIGIMARDTLCRHGRAGPGHPDAVRRGASHHRDHRHKAGDDGEDYSQVCGLCSHFVLDSWFELSYIVAQICF
jgi:hypothetical protein